MKLPTIGLITLLASAALGLSVRAADTSKELFQKGVVEEEANRNLDAAVEAYRAVVTRYDEERKITANALFRLAESLRKQGRTNDAVAAYSRIVAEFADQQQLAELSRKHVPASPAGGQRRQKTSAELQALADQFQREVESIKRSSDDLRKQADRLAEEFAAAEAEVRTAESALNAVSGSASRPEAIPIDIQDDEFKKLKAQYIDLAVFKRFTGTDEERQKAAAAVASQIESWLKQVYIPKQQAVRDLARERRDMLRKERDSLLADSWRTDREADGWLNALASTHGLTPEETRMVRTGKIEARPEVLEVPARASSSPPATRQTAIASAYDSDQGEIRLLQREVLDAEQLLANTEALYNELKKKSRAELRRTLPSAAPDSNMDRLLAELQKVQRDHASATTSYGNGHPEVLKHVATMKQLEQQIEERIDGILAGLETMVVQRRTLSEGIRKKLDEAQSADAQAEKLKSLSDEESKELERVQAMVKDSPDLINSHPAPLQGAVQKGFATVTEFLLKNGADPNFSTGQTAMHMAAAGGRKTILELLLAHGGNPNVEAAGHTPLHVAALNGHRIVAEVLLEKGANVASRGRLSELERTMINRPGQSVQADPHLYDVHDQSPLHVAAIRGFKPVVELLLSRDADVNATNSAGLTPLHYAARVSSPEVAKLLIAKGADVNRTSRSGETPLHLAVSARVIPLVKLLLESGADPNLQDSAGFTPFAKSLNENVDEAMVRLLIANKADPNLAVRDGTTPLMMAARWGFRDIVQLLLDAGAQPNARLRDGKTVLDVLASARKSNPPIPGQTIPGPMRRPSQGQFDHEGTFDLLRKVTTGADSAQPASPVSSALDPKPLILITGAVRTNALPLLAGERKTVFEAVTLSGVKDPANWNRVTVNRLLADGQSTNIVVDLDAVRKGDRSKDIEVQAGDRIHVPERMF